jgi:predicted molibdopterin-dependent oxidoreductase YjgC
MREPSVDDLRVPAPAGPARGTAFTFRFDGHQVTAHPGETIGAALLAAGIRHLRTTRVAGAPRGLLCGIGSCFDCLVTVDGHASQRACLTPATPDAEVEVQDVPRPA